jgi:hypothetical protein
MMTDEELIVHLDKLAQEFTGDFTELSSAIGAFWLGRVYGWRVLRIVTSSRIYTRHQRILGLDFKKELPRETAYSRKSVGYKIVTLAGKFWDVVQGKDSIDPKQKAQLE